MYRVHSYLNEETLVNAGINSFKLKNGEYIWEKSIKSRDDLIEDVCFSIQKKGVTDFFIIQYPEQSWADWFLSKLERPLSSTLEFAKIMLTRDYGRPPSMVTNENGTINGGQYESIKDLFLHECQKKIDLCKINSVIDRQEAECVETISDEDSTRILTKCITPFTNITTYVVSLKSDSQANGLTSEFSGEMSYLLTQPQHTLYINTDL